MAGGTAGLALTVFAAQLRDRPVRFAVAILAIAVGIALAAGVYLVNESALAEFSRASRELAGEADLVARGPREGFGEALFARLAAEPGVRIASPVLELDAALAGGGSLPVVGLDPLAAGAVQPALYGELAGRFVALLAPDAIALSAPAAAALGLSAGGTLAVRVGAGERRLRVVAVLPESAYGRRLGVMDIASAQWTLGALGRLTRIDLRLAPGTDPSAFAARVALPAGVALAPPRSTEARVANLTRAYRVNLDMLALVALLTGAFLVFASQTLGVLRRVPQFALMRALGVTRRALLGAVVLEGAAVGTAGGALGTLAGLALARAMLAALGGDLGAGYFEGAAVPVAAPPGVLAAFVLLGVATAIAGAWLPARRAARIAPALALKPGATPGGEPGRRLAGLALGLALLGLAAAFGPPLGGLPVFGYAAIALLLFAAVALVPTVAGLALGACRARRPVAALALAQLRGTLAESSVSLAAIVVSFSLMVAMATMVHSFRDSLEGWLNEVLPADLYFRVDPPGDTAFVTAEAGAALARLPGVARLELRRSIAVALAPDAPLVAVIGRPLEDAPLPVIARATTPAPDLPPLWASEAMRDLYGYGPGQVVTLPIGGEARRFWVAAIWRDYAHGGGAVAVERATLEAMLGERRYTDGSLWLAPGVAASALVAAARPLVGGGVAFLESTALKRRSLAAFDRAFAITYALEAFAVAIGLLGVALAFASQALARRAEFGMLRHLGLRRRDVLAMLAREGALLGTLGAGYGLLVGLGLSTVLVYVVNRQSFHWSLGFVVPAGSLALAAAALVAAAAVTALVAGRFATAPAVTRAVREDW